jgi:hypothetical protein
VYSIFSKPCVYKISVNYRHGGERARVLHEEAPEEDGQE